MQGRFDREEERSSPRRETEELHRNLGRFAKLVLHHGFVTRAELREILREANSTVGYHAGDLRAARVLDESLVNGQYRLAAHLAVLAGVVVYHDGACIMLSNAAYEPLMEKPDDFSLDLSGSADAALETIAEHLVENLTALGQSGIAQLVVGLGLPAPVDVVAQKTASERILRSWWTKEPCRLLEEAVAAEWEQRHPHGPPLLEAEGKVKVFIHNDASLGAWGCHHTDFIERARGSRPAEAALTEPLLYVRITDGIGMGIWSRGLFDGSRGLAGEFGHLRVGENTPTCRRCEGEGCLETVASNYAIVERLVQGKVLEPGATIENALTSTRKPARATLRNAGTHFGLALAHAVNLLNPGTVVIGGAVSQNKDFRAAMEARLDESCVAETHVAPLTADSLFPEAEHHVSAELAGAAAYAGRRGLWDVIARRLRAYVTQRPASATKTRDARGR
jgi:predicted NBD/HSP70 family sugar kinase